MKGFLYFLHTIEINKSGSAKSRAIVCVLLQIAAEWSILFQSLWSSISEYSAEQNKATDLEKLFIVHRSQGNIVNN